ncbi:ABC transporter ATP-binding protein [Hoeflea prorocentri]|uniref:ABC transporter ATP-binding protein n=1 Tax=Hoeflea prorocentri TaxID=1922333 RepID=A0A9X3UR73_9HYPH|nr:ABC transporter ATP-binding protein [Hoeflea prorocentri]MCY6383721.1 ABC transporter ATP-binding protein [Hoeflea prorocentri]MDA5401521.1 ABC transporter ATP-binding protein [Hoeflea prorocentri]
MLLEVDTIRTSYGISEVLFGLSFHVAEGEVVGLLGRNGVGKSTTMRSIVGLTPPHAGEIRWRGKRIDGRPTYDIARNGVGFVPEDRRIFPELTVWENLDIARRASASGEGWTEAKVFALFPDLERIQGRKGGFLSGGQQQMLAIARALLGNPELLLLDEPSEGLAPLVVADLRDQIATLKEQGLSVVLAEQNLDFVLSLSDRVYILERGEIRFEGMPGEVRGNSDLIERYLTV